MAQSVYIIASECGNGLSMVALGLMQAMGKNGGTAFFRPVIEDPKAGQPDPAIDLIRKHFALEQSYEDSFAFTMSQARELLEGGKQETFIDTVLDKCKGLQKKYGSVLCLGTKNDEDCLFEFDLNARLAADLGASAFLLLGGKTADGIVKAGGYRLAQLREKAVDVLGCFLNSAGLDDAGQRKVAAGLAPCPVRALPVDASLAPDKAVALFASNMDLQELARSIAEHHSSIVTPKMFEYSLVERAQKHAMRIVLPEGQEERILRAAEILCQRHVAQITLLGDVPAIEAKIKDLGLTIDATLIDPEKSADFEDYVATYAELRKAKGVTLEKAREIMRDATYYGTMMVHKNAADGMVSGSINTTAHTIRPSFEFIKTKPGVSIVSSTFFVCLKDTVMVFADCAVNPNPTAEQLASIAISSAETAQIFGVDPKIAMLSYSTGTSGKGPDVDMVVEAVAIAREKAPELLLEGPLQYDAAVDMGVAGTKLPGSKVAGKATVLIFPDLNTGNNTYKAVQRSANALAIGPVLQGLNKPVNDLSRGATVADIVNTVAITAIQAQAEKGLLA